jgi:hypothetical protein
MSRTVGRLTGPGYPRRERQAGRSGQKHVDETRSMLHCQAESFLVAFASGGIHARRIVVLKDFDRKPGYLLLILNQYSKSKTFSSNSPVPCARTTSLQTQTTFGRFRRQIRPFPYPPPFFPPNLSNAMCSS